MRASKFPIMYRGERFKISVKSTKKESEGVKHDLHHVILYEKRTGFLSWFIPYRIVLRVLWRSNTDREDDVITSAEETVLRYVKQRDEQRAKEEVIRNAWCRFRKWDGEVREVAAKANE